MTTQQPKALQLADILQHKLPSIECLEVAAAERRRLHEVNTELLAALKAAEPMLQSMLNFIVRDLPQFSKMPVLEQARAAIALAERTTT